MSTRIRLRRDTAANWAAANPVLLLGEPGVETDTRKTKYGDGITAWNDLAYASGGSGGDATYSNTTPEPLGTATPGTESTAARGDHVHAMPTAAQVGAEPSGTAAAAVAAHLAAADPHPAYTTAAEAAAAAPVQSVALAVPSGWTGSSSSSGGNVTLSLGLPVGSSLVSSGDRTNWEAAYSERLRWDGGSTGLNATTARASLGLASVAASGAYGDLSGRPTLGTAAALDSGTGSGNVPVLDGAGKVPSALLPSYVDDVIEAANLAGFPGTGETGKVYVAIDTGKTYRWGGSSYVEISASPGSTDAVPEGSVNLYHTTARASAAAPVQTVAGRTGAVILGVADVTGALSTATAATTYQPLDSDLTALAALSTTGLVNRTGAGTAATVSAPAGAIVGTTDTQTLTNKTLGTITESVFAITDGASVDLNPSNGSIQTWTLGASRVATANNFPAGASMLLAVDDGTAFTLTWPTITWVGSTTAPTLATTGFTWIQLWKVGSTLYGMAQK